MCSLASCIFRATVWCVCKTSRQPCTLVSSNCLDIYSRAVESEYMFVFVRGRDSRACTGVGYNQRSARYNGKNWRSRLRCSLIYLCLASRMLHAMEDLKVGSLLLASWVVRGPTALLTHPSPFQKLWVGRNFRRNGEGVPVGYCEYIVRLKI